MSADNYGNEIPAAVQHTDEEYAYPPVGWKPVGSGGYICAAEEQFATHAEVQRATDDVCAITDELEARMADFEQRLRNVECAMPHPSSGARRLTEEYLQGFTDGQATGEHNALASVPWEALRAMKRAVQRSGVIDPDDAEDVDIFLDAHAPKEIAE